MKKKLILIAALCGAVAAMADVKADFTKTVRPMRPEIHSSGFGPTICSQTPDDLAAIKAMGFKAARTHDWALVNSNQRVCDYFHIFPLMHLDAKDPKNYHFAPTDYLLKRTREETGLDIFYRLGTSIEHSGNVPHFNALIPEDFDKVAEIFAATVRHYNRGWANGFEWGIKYWEIWNEPDGLMMWCLPDGDEGKGATAEERKADYEARLAKRRALFVKFFVKCLKRLKDEFGDTIKVGGPALVTCDEVWLKDIFSACRDAGLAPDFISWHGYLRDPAHYVNDAGRARRLCDAYGFTKCELIVNEWHYIPKGFGWDNFTSSNPVQRSRIWDGPDSLNGIESACFVLATLANMEHSELDQAYYYGCRHTGSWGYMDYNTSKRYKVYHALRLFGDIVRDYDTICASVTSGNLYVFAASGDGGRRKGVLVVDYGGANEVISFDVAGVPANAKASGLLLDYTHDLVPWPVSFKGRTLTLRKPDRNSAAFFVEFE